MGTHEETRKGSCHRTSRSDELELSTYFEMSDRQHLGFRQRTCGDSIFVPRVDITALPALPDESHPGFLWPSHSSLPTPSLNGIAGDKEQLKRLYYTPLVDEFNIFSSPYESGPRAVPDNLRSSDHSGSIQPATTTCPVGEAASSSGGMPVAPPTPMPTSHRSQGSMLSDPGSDSTNASLAAVGHQFDHQYTEDLRTEDGIFSQYTGILDPESLPEASRLPPYSDTATNLYAPKQQRAVRPQSRTGRNMHIMHLTDVVIDTLDNSIWPSYDDNANNMASGRACAGPMALPTANLDSYVHTKRSPSGNVCHIQVGQAVRHPHHRLHPVAEVSDIDLMTNTPAKVDSGQRSTPRQLLPLVRLDSTFLSPSHSALPLSGSKPQEPVRFLTRNSTIPMVPHKRSRAAISSQSPLNPSSSLASRRSHTSCRLLDSVEVCPHCCFVSKGKKRSDRKSNLNRHIRDKHERAAGMKPMCLEAGCGKTFERSDYVLRHLRKSHGLRTAICETASYKSPGTPMIDSLPVKGAENQML